jgi:2-polyprenyl-6-methoxyphenol hydroxylase-like FAD-dependent oxidoreductase
MKALIAGAGPGGLTAALHLHRAGIDCEVYESVAEIRPLGVGLNLLPHAVRELTILGLGHRLAAAGIATAELAYFNKFGAEIWREPRGIAAGYRWPQYSIHRGVFQQLLLDEFAATVGREHLHTGRQLSSFAQDEHGVTALFTVEECRGDVLIAADGIHSTARKAFYPDETPPPYCGRVLWRAVTDAPPFLSGRSMIMAGYADRKFVAYPIGGGTINWVADVFVGGDQPAERDWNRRSDPPTVLRHFAGWRFDWLDIPALIEGAGTVFEYPLVDRDPLPRWSFGRVTLLGDAAHPMYPIGSNGASQAILDAAALADALGRTADPVEALRAYEAERREKTAQIVLSNRQQGPEIVMQMVEERAPAGFTNLHDVISRAELEEVANRYKAVAGFDRDRLNAMAAPGALD